MEEMEKGSGSIYDCQHILLLMLKSTSRLGLGSKEEEYPRMCKEGVDLSLPRPSHYFLPPEAYQVSHESGHPQGHPFPPEQVEQVSVVESEPEPEPKQPRHKEKQRPGKEPKKG